MWIQNGRSEKQNSVRTRTIDNYNAEVVLCLDTADVHFHFPKKYDMPPYPTQIYIKHIICVVVVDIVNVLFTK